MAKSKQKGYLIHLSSNGDTIIKVINQITWNYIHTPRPKFVRHSATEKLPIGAEADTEEPTATIVVTSGSCENDRALQVKGIARFTSPNAYTKWVKENNFQILDEYTGCIY